jgi:GNAT superfamily N-acetyltransferase
VNDLAPILRLFTALDERLVRVQPTPWGAVVTDPRYPAIHDVNYARVDDGSGVSLADVEAALIPALRAAGAAQLHIATFDPVGSRPLLDELEAAGARFTYDTAMRFVGPSPEPPAPGHVVGEIAEIDDAFWAEQRAILPELDIRGDVLDQYLDWQRDVLVPFGKRWFVAREQGRLVGTGALVVHDGVAYVDDVVTVPDARRRGVGGAVVTRIVAEGLRSAEEVFLLADEPGPIRLYERLGFVEAGLVIGAVLASR